MTSFSFVPCLQNGIAGYACTCADTGEHFYLVLSPSNGDLRGGPGVSVHRSPTMDPHHPESEVLGWLPLKS
jgi:hypothetical protein